MSAFKNITITSSNGVNYRAEYYPHKKIIVRVCGFKVVVAKPYGAEIYKDMVCTSPSIHISTNATIITDLNELENMQDVIKQCIKFLNNENDGIIMLYDFRAHDRSGNIPYCRKNKVPQEILAIQGKDAVQSVKSIPYKEITSQAVYEDVKGHKWIYVGNGILYNNIMRHVCNKSNCHEIYINYDALETLMNDGDCFIDENGDFKINKPVFISSIIDSYATRKRFIKKIKDIKWNGCGLYTAYDHRLWDRYNFKPNYL